MKPMRPARKVICPVCSAAREITPLYMPRLRSAFLSSGVALALFAATALTSDWTAAFWAGGLCGVLFFLGSEVYYGARYRRELTCPVCQFDPILYRRSPDKAKQQCLDGLKQREEFLSARWRALQRNGSPSGGA